MVLPLADLYLTRQQQPDCRRLGQSLESRRCRRELTICAPQTLPSRHAHLPAAWTNLRRRSFRSPTFPSSHPSCPAIPPRLPPKISATKLTPCFDHAGSIDAACRVPTVFTTAAARHNLPVFHLLLSRCCACCILRSLLCIVLSGLAYVISSHPVPSRTTTRSSAFS